MYSQNAIRWARSPATVAAALAFAAFLIAALIQGEKPFYYDSEAYWALADTFAENGHFSLFDYGYNGLRGYALPLTYYVVQQAAGVVTSNDSLMVMGYNALVFALIGAALAPRLAEIAWPQLRWSVPRRLALCALLLTFWHGYLSFPLSDFPALAAALLALVAVSSFSSPGWMLAAGCAAGLALDFRPAYVLFVPGLLSLAVWGWATQRDTDRVGKGRLGLCIGLFVAGIVLISLPQSIAAHRRSGDYSPIPGGSGLAGLQYTEGLHLQRYDTFVGGTPEEARMNYFDPHTAAVVADLEGGEVSDTRQYVEIVFEHPVAMAGVFLRHIVNGLDQRYTTPYVEKLQTRWNRIWRFAGFLIVFLALVRVLWPAARRGLEPARWRYPAVLMLGSATSIASAVETRFMLPVFVLCAMLVLAPGWPPLFASSGLGLRRYRTATLIAAAAALFYAGVWAIVSGATDNLQLGAGG